MTSSITSNYSQNTFKFHKMSIFTYIATKLPGLRYCFNQKIFLAAIFFLFPLYLKPTNLPSNILWNYLKAPLWQTPAPSGLWEDRSKAMQAEE